MLSGGYNIERIIYPTGAETRYRYKFLLPLGMTTKVRHGIYGVEASYDIVDGTVQNSKEYSFTNNRMEITSTCLNNSALTKTVSQYNASGTLKKIQTQPQTGYLPSKSVIYTYDTHNNLTMVVTNENGTSKTINYTYDSLYPNVLAMENDGSCKVTYEYHTKTFTTLGSGETKTTITDIPSQITYSKIQGKQTIDDYSITTELTPDNKSVQYERVAQNEQLQAQKKYEYDANGENISIKQWTNNTNSDNILDENDDFIEVSKGYTITNQNTRNVINSVSNVLNADGANEGTVSVRYQYNIYGSPLAQTDSYGAAIDVEYDDINRPIKYTMPNGSTREIEYNSAQNYTLVTDEAGIITKTQYDGLGRLKAKYKKNGSVFNKLEEYDYDAAGRLSSKTVYRNASAGVKETYTYDAIDRMTQKNVYELPNILLYTENYAYTNNLSQATVTKTTVADGVTAATEKSYYNKYGQLTKTERISGGTTLTNLYEYDYLGRVIKETDPKGNETAYEYNYAGQVTKTTDAAGNEVNTVYDLAGRAVSVTDANGHTTNTYYDKLGRAIKTVSPFYTTTAETKTYYDKNSHVVQTSVKRRNNAYLTERFQYDSMGNLVADIKNDGTTDIVTAYQYDTANRITAMITGLTAYSANPTGGAVTSYTYNNQGYLAKITDPMGTIELYNSYDYFGNITSMTDKKGNLMYNQYGAFGLKKAYFLGLSEKKEYTYNNIGQLTHTKSVNSGENVEESYNYDAFGRLVSMESNDGSVQNYTYDANSNVTSYQLLDGNTITNSAAYSYNSLNQLSELSNNGITASYAYDGNGNMTQKALSTGITINCEYNPLNIMDYIETKRGNTRHAYSSCEYAPSGELSYLIMQSDYSGSMRAKDFFYDDAGRLTMEDGPHPLNTTCTNQYTYDLRGNRTGLTRLLSGAGASETTSYTYTYDLNNRLVSSEYEKTDGSEGEEEYYYDNNGNLTSVDKTSYDASNVCDTQTLTYGYDAFNRLISYSDGTTVASYTYNADNLRASKTVDNTRTDFVWNGQNLAAESVGNTINTYTYDITGVHIANQGGTVSAYYKDYHGNVIGRIDTDGEMIGERLTNPDYDAFGNQLKSTFTTAPFGYCGEYYDSESGLIYLRNRYYDSELGRFINEDPIRDGTNWYAYCENNPVMMVDPTGTESYPDYWRIKDKYGWGVANSALKYANLALSMAENYAVNNGLNSTWNNKADAYRHFMWNAMLTRHVGYYEARYITNLHEYMSMEDSGWLDTSPRFTTLDSPLVYGRMNQETFMDLWNNQVGRELANNIIGIQYLKFLTAVKK